MALAVLELVVWTSLATNSEIHLPLLPECRDKRCVLPQAGWILFLFCFETESHFWLVWNFLILLPQSSTCWFWRLVPPFPALKLDRACPLYRDKLAKLVLIILLFSGFWTISGLISFPRRVWVYSRQRPRPCMRVELWFASSAAVSQHGQDLVSELASLHFTDTSI